MTDPMTPLTAESEALLERIYSLNGRSFPLATREDFARIEAAAVEARALEGSGVVEALEGLVEAIVTAPLVEVEDETTITLCVPLAAIKPAYWAACAAIGHQPTDPGPYCARCGATITAVVQSAEHHPGDCAAVEKAGSSPARGDALPRPEEPQVERCAWCGTPIAEHPLTDACAIAQESEAR